MHYYICKIIHLCRLDHRFILVAQTWFQHTLISLQSINKKKKLWIFNSSEWPLITFTTTTKHSQKFTSATTVVKEWSIIWTYIVHFNISSSTKCSPLHTQQWQPSCYARNWRTFREPGKPGNRCLAQTRWWRSWGSNCKPCDWLTTC